MSNEELRAQANGSSGLIRVGGGLWAVGIMIVMFAAITWVTLAVMAGDYFTNPNAVRDAADAVGAASGILSQQGSIEAVKAWVLPLAFVGLGTFIVGFGFAFANILANVRLRANTMAAGLPELKQRKTGRSQAA